VTCVLCSYDQLVLEHRLDPEEVLLNLGFMKHSKCDSLRIPDHFLLYQSKARGITSDEYLEDNPTIRQHLDQKLALENAFRAVNRTPPSPAHSQTDGNFKSPSADFSHLKDRLLNFAGVKCRSKGESLEECRVMDAKGEIENSSNGYFDGNSVHFEGRSPGFQGHLKGNYLSFAISTVSALFADDRLPMRYLESLLNRLRNGPDPDQAALTFDGYSLRWSWKLDSESLSSCWLPSSDLDSFGLPEESVPTDDWSMQQPTAGDWSADPPTAADWLARPPAAHDWAVRPPTSDTDHVWHSADFLYKCSMLPALQRPLTSLLPTTDNSFLEFPDQSHDLTDGQNLDFPRHGGIFCDCCDHRSSGTSGTKSWDHLDTVDFYIDDSAEAIAGYCPPAGGMPSQLRKSNCSPDDSHKGCRGAEQDKDDVWNYLLTLSGNPSETLV